MSQPNEQDDIIFNYTCFSDPTIKPMSQWISVNKGFYARFRKWLRDGGYSRSTISLYSVVARLTLGWLDKPYWLIDLEADIQAVRDYIVTHYERPETRKAYLKGLTKLTEYLRQVCHKPAPVPQVNWAYYLQSLPDFLVQDLRTYLIHRARAWLPEEKVRSTSVLLSCTTRFLRWAAREKRLETITDLTPELWFDYLDQRLAQKISPVTLNTELSNAQSFLLYLSELDRPVCQRFLLIERLKEGPRLPKDVPLDQLRLLQQEIETDAAKKHRGIRRMGLMDRAWFRLMLHCGLRSGEVRRLQLPDLDLAGGRVRIEQSKGLKDRIVYLSQATVEALQAYLEVRGPMATDHIFSHRHLPLSVSYFSERLRTFARRCGVRVTPHQLRHSCATLLLNAGAPILTVQALLGHKQIDTTLRYARLYDGTVATDYYRAMAIAEQRLNMDENASNSIIDSSELLALVDSLSGEKLTDTQREIIQSLRACILSLSNLADGNTSGT